MTRREIAIETELSANDLRAAARRQDNRRAAMRMLAIANEIDGYEREEAARLAGMLDQALRDAIKRFNADGIEGLFDRPRSGRPRRLDAEQEASIRADVLKGPDIEADGFSSFTLKEIRQMITAKHGAEYHIGYMGTVMRRLQLSRQKARPSHPKKDPAAEAAFKKCPTKTAQNCSHTRKAR